MLGRERQLKDLDNNKTCKGHFVQINVILELVIYFL